MRFEYCPNHPQHHATNLRYSNGNLRWNSANEYPVLLVQTPYGIPANNRMAELVGDLSKQELQPEQYTPVCKNVFVRMVTPVQKIQMNGCPINQEASTYTVFSCSIEGDVCKVYAPVTGMIRNFCNISMNIHVEVEEEIRPQGWFKRNKPTGFYKLTFPRDCPRNYIDGGLVYEVENMQIPITAQMMNAGVVYVKSWQEPRIVSTYPGLQVI